MVAREVILQALIALINHRFRAAMTMLGISWGIVTVVLLMAYGDGFHSALIVGFFILGFLCGYLYTRTFLQGAFARSDPRLMKFQQVLEGVDQPLRLERPDVGLEARNEDARGEVALERGERGLVAAVLDQLVRR